MGKRKLIKDISILMVVIFLLNVLALKFYWYSSVSWFDMLMHFLGGVWLGFFFFYLFSYVFSTNYSFFKKFLILILCVLLIGVLWEGFEYVLDVISHESFDIVDTLSDVFFDFAGGLAALLYCFKRIMPAITSEV